MEFNKEEITGIKKDVQETKTNVALILSILQGHELDEADDGMIGDLKRTKTRLAKLEMFKVRATWFLIGLGIPASYGIMDILSWLLSKK